MERKNRERKSRPARASSQPEDSLDPELEEFEEVDLTAVAPSVVETTAEAVAGLASSEEFQALVNAQREIEARLLVEPAEAMAAAAADGPRGLGNIVGVGIGEKAVDGIPTGQLAVKVLVKEKLRPDEVAAEALVPDEVAGVPTDIDVSGEIRAEMFTMRLRPAPGGVSVGNCGMIMAGTLGCLVRRASQLFVLSNNHVLALVNTSPVGTLIPQPGRLDGGACPGDAIARLTQFIPITFAGQCNFVDCAIAQASPSLVDRRILRPGGTRQPLQAPVVAPVLNQLVQKSGRTTQFRRGIIDLVNATVNVSYAPLGGVARFCQQFRVRGAPPVFSDRGDSGSLVTTAPRNNPVGLLFAGNAANNQTFCNPIRAVLDALAVSIVF
jgi:hypothetical protein